nr:unnamed protein product [Callosobruchus analis]
MQIIPDLYNGEWKFREDDPKSVTEVCGISDVKSLTPDQIRQLNCVVDAAFKKMGDKLGCTHLVEHRIVTSSPPIKQRYYPLSPALQQVVNKELDALLAKGIVEPSQSAWASPIVLVPKKDGSWRFCVNYKRLNSVSTTDAYPIPYVSAILDKLRDARFITSLDIKSAYYQIKMADESKPLTAFTVPNRGLFQFTRMPFGLHSAPATWQRLIDRVLGVDLDQHTFVYLDDIIICTPTFEKHIEVLGTVLKRIVDAGLTLNREKSQFCRPELRYLGYVVNAAGLLVDPSKVEAILRMEAPKNVTEVRRIVGLASWYRRFVPSFSSVVSPLTQLTEKNRPFVWTEECDKALSRLKQSLVSAPVLTCPDFTQPFFVETDASSYGLGVVLTQRQNGQEKVICYLSRSLTKAERKYSVTEKELLAVLFGVEKLRPYIEGTHFTVVTDHYSLKWLFSIKEPTGRIARWQLRLQAFDFDVIHRKGKDHIVPDVLSRSVPIIDVVDVDVTHPSAGGTVSTDPWYSGMIQKVTSSPDKYPLWRVRGKQLYKHVEYPYPSLTQADNWILVVPKNQRQNIIGEHHNPPTCAHLGTYKTLARISAKYYWPKMRADVARPWQSLSVDVVGPLPRSSQGYSYILSVLDVFSKFVLFFPMRRATAAIIAKLIEEQVFLVYGVPARLVTDNGAHFKNKLLANLFKKYEVQHRFTALYHAQANAVERHHRVLKTALSSYVAENQRQWDRYLPQVAAAIRSAKSEVTQVTPNFVIFGREIILSGKDHHVDQDAETIGCVKDTPETRALLGVTISTATSETEQDVLDAEEATGLKIDIHGEGWSPNMIKKLLSFDITIHPELVLNTMSSLPSTSKDADKENTTGASALVAEGSNSNAKKRRVGNGKAPPQKILKRNQDIRYARYAGAPRNTK